jgi:hypothetical protein
LPAEPLDDPLRRLQTRRHLLLGWWSIFVFGTVGLILETFHGFKVGAYLDVANETRRLMWTLAHAHGTLLGLVHVAFAVTLGLLPSIDRPRVQLISRALVTASILLPGGFFLGGIQFYAGDPGIGVAVVPLGAAALLLAAWWVARAVHRERGAAAPAPSRKRA